MLFRSKTFRDPDDGIEIWAMPDGGFDVVNTMNSNGRNHCIQNGGKKLGTIGQRHKGVAEGSLREFAPGDSGDDGFDDDVLKQLAAQWYNGDEDPRVEKTLAAAGWEIGQDEGYDDEPGVFVVQAGDINGNSYQSWPADELRGLTEKWSAKYKRSINCANPKGFSQQIGRAHV